MYAILILPFFFGCSDHSPPTPRDLQGDVAKLQRTMTDDLELVALDEVEKALADDLPYRAAQLLMAGALPASERHVSHVEELTFQTKRGQRLGEEAKTLLRARADALKLYGEALQNGFPDDLQSVRALRAQRNAESAIDSFLGRLEELRPLHRPN